MGTAAFCRKERREDGELRHFITPLLVTDNYRRFSGDESFVTAAGDPSAIDAGSGLGVVVEGNKGKKSNFSSSHTNSRL